MGWSDFFTQIADIVGAAERQPAPTQKTGRPLASWSTPAAPEPVYRGSNRPQDLPQEWSVIGGSTNTRGGPRLNENSETRVRNGHTELRNPNWMEERQALETSDSQAAREEYELRLKRMDALGLSDELGMKAGALTTVDLPKGTPLSQEAYDALSGNQRAAVDFNTLLSEAVKKDLKYQDKYKPSKDERERFDAAEKAMFGSDRGSDNDIFAPETMAVLRQLHIGKDKAADFDDYLGLKVVITPEEVAHIDSKIPDSTPATMANPQFLQNMNGGDSGPIERARLVQDQAARTNAALKEVLGKGRQMAEDFRTTLQLGRRNDVADMGGINAAAPQQLLGFGEGASTFSRIYDQLLVDDPKTIKKNLLADAKNDPEGSKALMEYLNRRTQNDTAYGLDISNPEDGVPRHSAAELRKILGLDGSS